LDYSGLSEDRIVYIKRLAFRYVNYRRSSSIDAEDLVSSAMIRWWEFSQVKLAKFTEVPEEVLFRQQVKFAMRDLVRNSEPVKLSRSYKAKLQAYETPYAVSLDTALHIQEASSDIVDTESWLDIVGALQQLSTKEQLILSLSVEQGYTFTEIAYTMDVAVSTVTRQYQAALTKIKNILMGTEQTRKKKEKPTDTIN